MNRLILQRGTEIIILTGNEPGAKRAFTTKINKTTEEYMEFKNIVGTQEQVLIFDEDNHLLATISEVSGVLDSWQYEPTKRFTDESEEDLRDKFLNGELV